MLSANAAAKAAGGVDANIVGNRASANCGPVISDNLIAWARRSSATAGGNDPRQPA